MPASLMDLYLAGTMAPSDDTTGRLACASVSLHAAQVVAAQARRFVFPNPLSANLVDLIAFFGPYGAKDPLGISYNLTLWPSHCFRWDICRDGTLTPGGFVLRTPEWLPGMPLTEFRDPGILRPWHHTMSDVIDVLGPCDGDLPGFPQDLWVYGPMPDGHDWCLTFDLGLLRSVTREPTRTDRHGLL